MASDETEQGALRDYCPSYPNDGHAMVTHCPANSRLAVRMCSVCDWIDGESLQRQLDSAVAVAEQRGRAGAIAELRDRGAVIRWLAHNRLRFSEFVSERELHAEYLEAQTKPAEAGE